MPEPSILKINEIFWSFQGEGVKIGFPSIFIRLAGCQLRCPYCDTKESWEDENAQSMKVEGILAKVENYKKRIDMGGWAEELYYSYLQYAVCKQHLGEFPVEDFLLAYDNRPSRSEALYALARHYRLKGNFVLGYTFARIGAYTPPTKDILFVQKDIEEWRMKDELAVSAYKVGQFAESLEVCDELLKGGKLPQNEIERVKKNREYARRNLALK